MSPQSRNLFYKARVTVLLSLLFCVAVWAAHDVWVRRARKDWKRTLDVAIVVVQTGPLDHEAVAALKARIPALESRLAAEMERYRPGAPRPFRFTVLGPIVGSAPPTGDADGIVAAFRHSYELWQYRRDVDGRGEVRGAAFDSRIYVAASTPVDARRQTVEGESEDNGRIGTVTVELDASMADLALAVVTHEALHTLGATDKYDARGAVLVPAGFAEPDLEPGYPQRFVEVMTRGRPLSPGVERPLSTLDELAVGPTTAVEIGWIRAPRR